MEEKEFKKKIKDLKKLNSLIHSSKGATTENIKRTNYLIIELLYGDNIKKADLFRAIAPKGNINQATFDLLCRITEQHACPSLIYDDRKTYTDDLSTVKNSAFNEYRILGSKWWRQIAEVPGMSRVEATRFAQCYMLIEQFGREEYVIDDTMSTINKETKATFSKKVVGNSYHVKSIEIDNKCKVISKLIYGDYSKYNSLVNMVETSSYRTKEEFELIKFAAESGTKFFGLKAYFNSQNSKGVEGDTGKYVFQHFKGGLPEVVDKYANAYSMPNATDEVHSQNKNFFYRLKTCADAASEYWKDIESAEEVKEVTPVGLSIDEELSEL